MPIRRCRGGASVSPTKKALGDEVCTRRSSVDGARLISLRRLLESLKPDGAHHARDRAASERHPSRHQHMCGRALCLKALSSHILTALRRHYTTPRPVARSCAVCRCGTVSLCGCEMCKGIGLLLLVPVLSGVLVTKGERLHFS
jgi:hypothetical protein